MIFRFTTTVLFSFIFLFNNYASSIKSTETPDNTPDNNPLHKKSRSNHALFWPNQYSRNADPSYDDDNPENGEEGNDGDNEEDNGYENSTTNTTHVPRHSKKLGNSNYDSTRVRPKFGVKRSQSVRKLRKPMPERNQMMEDYFIGTTPFVHGDTFFGLGRTTSGIVFGYFATMYFIFVLSTTLLLYQRRKDPSLVKFPLWLSHFIPAGINAFIVVLGFLRHMFRARFPCFIVLWQNGLLAPMYVVMIFEARSLNLIFEYHWNKRMQSLLQSSESLNTRPEDDSAAPVVLERSGRSVDQNLVINNQEWLWIKKYGMIAVIVGIFIFQFLMTLAIQIFSPYYKIWPKMDVYRCTGSLETTLPILALIMYTFVLPLYLSIQLKRINDSYGVRQDIYNAVTQSAWNVVLCTVVRNVYFVGKFVGYFPTGFATLLAFGLLHYHTVCAPLLRIYLWQWDRSLFKRKMRKLVLLRRRIESYIFPRVFRIRIDKKKKRGCSGSGKRMDSYNLNSKHPNNSAIKTPQPLKANKRNFLENSIRLRTNKKVVNGSTGTSQEITTTPSNNSSPVDSRLEAASPATSMSPILSPELKPPTFNQVLQDETLCELFERYTLLEFSRENLLFYRSVCSLRSTFSSLPSGAAQIFLVEKSRSLATQFIFMNSPAEINVPGPVRKRIESRLAELDIDLTLFDEAQREVFRLMQNWSFPRFLRTLPEAEIRRFNRKILRNTATTTLNTHTLTHTITQLEPISENVNIENFRSQQFRFIPPDSFSPLMATSVSSLTLPLNIADVSLSSSP